MDKRKILVTLLSLGVIGSSVWGLNPIENNEESNNSIKTVNNSTNTKQFTDSKSDVVTSNNVKEIYGTIETHYSRNTDPSIPENLLIEGASIVRLKVISTGEAEILPATEDFDSSRPFTPINAEVLDTVYGNTLSGEITVYISGGDIKIANLIDNTREKESIDKMGLNDLSQDEKESQYISFLSEDHYMMEVGEEYMVIIGKQDENVYRIISNGYGIFEIPLTNASARSSNKLMYTNVLTGKEFDLQFPN